MLAAVKQWIGSIGYSPACFASQIADVSSPHTCLVSYANINYPLVSVQQESKEGLGEARDPKVSTVLSEAHGSSRTKAEAL